MLIGQLLLLPTMIPTVPISLVLLVVMLVWPMSIVATTLTPSAA